VGTQEVPEGFVESKGVIVGPIFQELGDQGIVVTAANQGAT